MSGFLEYFQFVLAPQMITGLALGVAVVLVALGLTIIFGLLDVINMAHGEFYALGAYLAATLVAKGASFWLCLALVPVAMAAIGYFTERTLIQRVFHSKDRHILTLLLTFGLAIIAEDAFKLVYGPNPYKPESPIAGASEVLGILLPNYRLILSVAGASRIVAVWLD